MAKTIYQIMVRNYSQEGTFEAVRKDLKRIKDLGVDIIYLTPIHEIGTVNRKGTYGSPYAIKDYFSISQDLGTLEDFIALINDIHSKGMKVMLDMVFNHTSPDNVLVNNHPEYYFYRNGKRGNRIGDWSDIVDLDTSREDTQDYLVSVLKYYADLGVDGFRFDVASLIDINVYKKAREVLGKDILFLGESVSPDFLSYVRSQNMIANSDEDLMSYFDELYSYNWYHDLENYLLGKGDLKTLVNNINSDIVYRVNTLENHDRERIASLVTRDTLLQLLDFSFFIKGDAFLFMGQEYGLVHKPELFEKDPVIWSKDKELYNYVKKLVMQKKEIDVIKQRLTLINEHEVEVEILTKKGENLIKRFNF